MGLQWMIGEMVMRCDVDLSPHAPTSVDALRGHTEPAWRDAPEARAIAGTGPALARRGEDRLDRADAAPVHLVDEGPRPADRDVGDPRRRPGAEHRRGAGRPGDVHPEGGVAVAVEHGGDYVTHDLRFHQGLLRACHNRMVVQMSKALGALLRGDSDREAALEPRAVTPDLVAMPEDGLEKLVPAAP